MKYHHYDIFDLLLFSLLAPIVYLIYTGWINPLLYLYSTVNPYIYYSYSPGFWSVDISFWIFTPLMIYAFRIKEISWIRSILYAISLDAASIGAFLTYFSLVYGINIFHSTYYTMTFYFLFLGLIPIRYLRISNVSFIVFFLLIDIGLVWKMVGAGNIGYFVSWSVAFDLISIFLFFLLFASLTPRRRPDDILTCDCCHILDRRENMFFAFVGGGKICSYCLKNCGREERIWIHKSPVVHQANDTGP